MLLLFRPRLRAAKSRLSARAILLLLTMAWLPAIAQDQIPEESGLSGFAMLAYGHFNVASNLFVRGAPLAQDVGDPQIESIFDSPHANGSPGILVGGELNYTFGGTRTQLFIGNRLEDLLRLDLVVGIGVRQRVGKGGIFAASVLFTPVELEFWSDPYVEGEDRRETDVNFPGFRLRWGQIFGTGLELTVTDRFYRFDEDTSGDWLIGEGRLDPDDQPSLDRSGDILRIQALYRIEHKRHRFEPAIRWVNDNHDGGAIANSGFTGQLTYLYFSPKVILDVNLIYGFREADEVNPIYGVQVESDRWAAALTAFVPVKRYSSSVLNLYLSAEALDETATVDFYDSSISMIAAGVLWRHLQK